MLTELAQVTQPVAKTGFDWNPWATLAGVVLGALLTPIIDAVRERCRLRALKRDLHLLLRSTLGTIDEKRVILKKSIAALRKGRAIPGYHVRFQLDAVRGTVAALGSALPVKDRNLLHNIIERMRVHDEMVETHYDRTMVRVDQVRTRLSSLSALPAIETVHNQVAGSLEDLDAALAMSADLIRKYLSGVVEDVCHLEVPFAPESPAAAKV